MTAIKTTLNESPGSARPTTPTDNLPRSNTDDALRYLAELLGGLVIGVDVQAWDADLDAWALVNPSSYSTTAEIAAGYQPLDADLTAIAALATTAFGRSFLVYASEATFKAGVNLEIGVDVQAWDADLDALAANSTSGLWARTGAGTGAARTITGPAAGISVTNGSGAAGNPTLALANDLAALEALGSTGLAARTGTDAWAQRTITGPAAGISVTNGSGAAGNPTLALADDLAALEGMSGTGLVARTASNTYAQRTLTAPAAGITVSNGSGVSGDPTLALANDLAAVEALATTGLARRTGTSTWSAGDLVTNAELANMAQTTIKARKTLSTGAPEDCTLSEVLDFIGSAAQGDILYRGSSAWARLGAGTNRQFLQTQGAAANPQWGYGGLTLLVAGTVSAAATLDLVLTSYTAYRGIMFALTDFVPATDATNLHMRVSTDGGATYDATGGNYRHAVHRVASNGGGENISHSDDSTPPNGLSAWLMATDIGNGSQEGASLIVELMGQTNTAINRRASWRGSARASGAQTYNYSGSGQRVDAQDTDAVRFMFSSGNIASGNYAVYGLA